MTPSRRDFIRTAALGLAAARLAPAWALAAEGEIPRRPLGRTGEHVSTLGLGGWHLGDIDDEAGAVRLARSAIDAGVTFLDNAWEYHKGRSEEIMGKALRDGRRQKVFLMTKHHGRDRKTALAHLDDSLRRLGTDVIDLWQFHEIIWPDDPDKIFAPGGGIEAAREAKEAGKVRFVGFTGHKDPALFKRMLEHDFPWDAVQMPVNVLDPHFRSFQKEILPILAERGIGAIGMKSLAGGHLLRTGAVTPQEAMRFAWSQPVATVVSGIDSEELLRKNVAYARGFSPMPAAAQRRLLDRTQPYGATGEYEPFKTTRQFDGPVGRAQHGM